MLEVTFHRRRICRTALKSIVANAHDDDDDGGDDDYDDDDDDD